MYQNNYSAISSSLRVVYFKTKTTVLKKHNFAIHLNIDRLQKKDYIRYIITLQFSQKLFSALENSCMISYIKKSIIIKL